MAKNSKIRKQKILAKKEQDRRPFAVAKYVRISPYKVRVVLDLVRNKSVDEAVAILENINKAAAEPVKKVILSAAANAEHNLNMNPSDLKVAVCYADQGPTLKRVQPVSKGRAYRILKRTSHITVVLGAIA